MSKLMPNLDQQGTKVLNLTVLQRIDPCIEDILLTAAHVAFYEFNIDQNQWSRKDVQGSLFVVKRNKEPWYQFIVMNQRNTENLVENLLGNFEFDVQVPYLLYKNATQEVNGIWFYNSHECEEVANLFNRIVDSYTRGPSKPLVSSKSEFKELEPVPSKAVMDGPLEPSSVPSPASTNAAEATTIHSFSNFFNAATNISNLGKPVQTYHPSGVHSASMGTSNLIPRPVGLNQVPPTITSTPSVPLVHHHDVPNPTNRSNQIANLVTPAIFHAPHSSSAVSVPPVSSSLQPIGPLPSSTLQPASTLQRPYGAPFLQPFPPPTPSPSLTPYGTPHGPIVDREKVREALLMLVQDDQFIDMVCKALQQVHLA